MKGGVGKTTLAANITRSLADQKPRRVLLIDADAQCNLSQVFFSEEVLESSSEKSIYHAFDTRGRAYGPGDLKKTIYSTTVEGKPSVIDFVLGSFDTFELNATAIAARRNAAAQKFKSFIAEAERTYDLIVIDTNPSATFVTMQALANANFLVAPITFDAFSMQGIHLVVHHLKEQFPWLSDPTRLCLVANKVPRSPSDGEMRRLEREEEKIKNKYPYLTRSLKLERVHASNLIANRGVARGFLADNGGQKGGFYDNVTRDFDDVAAAINLDLDHAFGKPKSAKQEISSKTRWWPFKGGSSLSLEGS